MLFNPAQEIRKVMMLVEGQCSQPTTLLEGQDYNGMFNVIFNMLENIPGGDVASKTWMKYINSHIKWAKETLRKNDRIVWYLRVLRYAILLGISKDVEKDKYEGLDYDYVNSFIEKLVRKNPELKEFEINSAGLDRTFKNIQEELKHYLGSFNTDIENYTWTNESFKELLNTFADLESQWKEKYGEDAQWLELQEGDEMVVETGPNEGWFKLNRHSCREEADAMGHCGNGGSYNKSERILSWRKRHSQVPNLWRPSMTFILDEHGYLGEMKGRDNDKPVEKYHPAIIKLITQPFIKGLKGGGYLPENNFSMDDLDQSTRDKILKDKPSLGDLKTHMKISGKHNPDVIERIQLMSDSFYLPELKWVDSQKLFVAHTYDNINGLIEERGNDTAKWILSVFEGTDELNIDYISDDAIDDLYEGLSDEYKEKLQSYASENYPDELEYNDGDVITTIKGAGDDVTYAFRNAIRDGEETGTQSEMINALVSIIDDYSIYFRHGDELKTQFIWDTECCYALTVDEVAYILDDDDVREIVETEENWMVDEDNQGYVDPLTINVDQPYYGFSGYDEDVAKERLEELLDEVLS